jgi:hypothetical protein
MTLVEVGVQDRLDLHGNVLDAHMLGHRLVASSLT